MSGASPYDSRAGLTLAELMIALIIGGMTLVITAQAASNVRRWTDRLGQAETDNTKTASLYQFMENTLSSTLPMTRTVDEKPAALFEGDENSVRFIRVEPGYPSRAGIYQYHLFNTKTPEGLWSLILEREIMTDPAQFGEPDAPARLTLFTDTQATRFAFTGGAEWQSEWMGKQKLPEQVQFERAGWPALTIVLPHSEDKAGTKPGESTKPKEREDRRVATPQKVEAGQ